MAGAKKTFHTSKALKKAVEDYLGGISRTRNLTEEVSAGEVDEKGRPILEQRVVKNSRGEPVCVREYLIPPTLTGLCLHLGISPRTWQEWCDAQAHPELEEATQWVMDILRAWNQEQLLTRKDVRGIIYCLENYEDYALREGEKPEERRQSMTMEEKLNLLRRIKEDTLGELMAYGAP